MGHRKWGVMPGAPRTTLPTPGAACPASVSVRNGHEKFAGPGHFNDPDMLVVGKVGWGRLHPTRLTPNEQYNPLKSLVFACFPVINRMRHGRSLDEFTLNLLTNDEVIDVKPRPAWTSSGENRSKRNDGGMGQGAGGWLKGCRIVQSRFARANRYNKNGPTLV